MDQPAVADATEQPRLRLCFCDSNRVWGGGEKWHLEMARRMAERGHTVRVLTDINSALAARACDAGLEVSTMPMGRLSFLDPVVMLALVRFFRAMRPHALVTGLPQDLKAAGQAARWARVPAVFYRRGMGLNVRDSAFNRRLYGRVAHGVIVNSRDTGRAVLANNPELVPQERIHLLPNGVEERLLRLPVTPCDRPDTPVIIGTAGRLVTQKGLQHLLEAMVLLRDKNVPCELCIAGEGPLERELKNKAWRTGIARRVHFLGFVKDMAGFYDSLHIFAFPSLWEGMGNAVLEAMARARPVVGFAVSSMPEIVEHGVTGFLRPGGDSAALAGGLAKLCREPLLRGAMGRAGRRRVQREFSLEKLAPRFEALLVRQVMQGARAGRSKGAVV